ncbi:hypothetical protein Tsubulata_028195 [Turnera subulata]|uniref:Uncharacterized protein n=1 Tax=Turnera subulata TaxID=218843 RepID=A0A9Q0FMZ3_9ROSI|nr:hypothetical protein Tsubulata_028195 [Turnera subulata]
MDSNTMEEIRRIESAMQVSVPALVRQYKFMVNRGKNIEDSGFDALIIAVEGSILPIINNLILSVICRGHWLAIMTIQGLSLFSLVVPLWWAYTRLQRLNAEAKFLEQCCVNLSDLAKTFGGELNGMLARMNLSRASLPNTGIKIYLDTLDQGDDAGDVCVDGLLDGGILGAKAALVEGPGGVLEGDGGGGGGIVEEGDVGVGGGVDKGGDEGAGVEDGVLKAGEEEVAGLTVVGFLSFCCQW